MISRREFLAGAAAAAYAQPPRKPNVIVIVADDLGYGETSPYGGKDVPTPNIESLARNGVRFTDGYVSCPVCSPTRAGLITGRYQQRFGHEFNPGPAAAAEKEFGLPLTESTIADRLKPLGYRRGMAGKWHLGYRPELHPLTRGFEEFFGFLGGAHSYLDPKADMSNLILRGREPVDQTAYLTDTFTQEAVRFIGAQRANPFFLYLTYNAVHGPLQATEKYLSRFQHIQDQKRRTFAAMLSALDDGVGQVLAKLREHRLEDDTLIFFVSDNGGPTPQTSSGNGALRGYKGQVFEGGIRVPFLVQWKRGLPQGRTYSHPVIALDILPTIAGAAGVKISGIDGVNLLPYLNGQSSGAPHDALYWRFGPQRAIRMGAWKMAAVEGSRPMLFHLAKDTGETQDLASQEPERLKTLIAQWERWNGQLMEPKWRNARQGRERRRRKKQ